MNTPFAETLKKLRTEKGLTQVQLGDRMYVNPSTVTRWETGSRLPDATMGGTGACGFMVKPLTPEGVRKQLERLRYPHPTGGARE